MNGYAAVSGGTSSLEVNRNSKGDYTWGLKLYFLGNDMRTIKQMIVKAGKTRKILEHLLGQKIVPTEDMTAYLRSLEAEVEKAIMQAEEEEAKAKDGAKASAKK